MAAVAARPLSNGALSELRKTCDECQSIKVRCDPMPSTSTSSSSASSSSSVADAQAPPTCQRCHRLGLQCVYSPKIKVIKRKRRKASEAEPPHNSPPQTMMPIAQQQQQQQQQQPFAPTLTGASPPVPHMLIDDSLAPPPPPQYGQRQGGQQQQQQRGVQGNTNGTGTGNEDWTDFFRWPEPPATPDFGAAPWEDWFRSLGPTSTTNTPAMDQSLLGGPPTANAFAALSGPSMNLGSLDPNSFTGCLPALHPAQRPTDAQMSAIPSPPPAAPSLPTPGPSRVDPNVTSNDDDARHRRGGSTPHVSHPPVPPLTRTLTTPATSAAQSQTKSTPAPTSAPAPAASSSCSSYTSTSLADFRPSNLEIKLSAISASLSTALDDCDIDRLIGLGGVTSRQARKRRSEAERKLLSLLVEADDVWREIDRLSRARMKEVEALMAADPAAKEDGGDAAEGSNSKGCGHKHARAGGGSSIKERMYARGLGSLVEPIRVTTSMLALSLSYQVCDALRLISRLLDAAGEYRGDYHDEEDLGGDDEDDEGEDSKDARSPSAFSPPDDAGSTTTNTTRDDPAAVEAARRLANIVSPVRIAGRPLPSSLHRPLVASLWTHHGESLLGSLVSSISLAQDWHHLGEGQGEGPHSFCAMQTQGARVVASLEALIQTRGGGSGAAACCGKLKRKRGETVTSATGAGTAAASTAKEGGASGEAAVRAE